MIFFGPHCGSESYESYAAMILLLTFCWPWPNPTELPWLRRCLNLWSSTLTFRNSLLAFRKKNIIPLEGRFAYQVAMSGLCSLYNVLYIYVQYVLYGFLYRNSSCIVYKHLCPCSCHVAFELLGPVVLSPCWSRLRARPAITTRGTHTSFQPRRATKATSHWRDAHSASLWLNIAIGPYA